MEGWNTAMESFTLLPTWGGRRRQSRGNILPKMLFWSVLVFLVHCTCADVRDHLLTYGPPKETLLTLEGADKTPTRVFRQKVKRFLSFNNDRSNIRVEMVFAIPVLHIPIGGNPVDGPYGTGISPVVDVNAKSVLAASVVLFMLFFVIPKLVRIFIPTFPQARALEESEIGRVLRSVESSFSVNSTACWQNCVCSLVQEGQQDKPSTSNLGKILDGIANMKWVERITAGTAFGEAMALGKSDQDGCKTFYSQCPLNSEKLGGFAKQMARKYMNHLIQLSNSKTKK